jgi:hypothetical protein
MKLFSDSAHLQHWDSLSHYSILLIFGSCIIAARSAKIATQTLSPAESEQYSTAEAVTYVVWITDFLKEMGHPPKQPIVLYHDNAAAVWMSTNGGQFTRTKHFLAKINFVMQNVTRKIVQLRLLPGIQQPADMGTKPQTSKAIRQHSKITGYTSGEYIE